MSTELVRYDAMCRAIAEAYEVDEVKDIRDRAIALEHYARQAKNKEALRQCAEIRLRAEIKAGELLAKMEKAKAAPGNQYTGPLPRENGSKTLADHGITPKQSMQWQQLAALPKAQIQAALTKPAIPSTNALLKNPRRQQREVELAEKTRKAMAKLNNGKLYNVIYADPPWRFEPYSRDTGMDRAADNHYPTMTVEAIKTLKIPAAADCELYIWATAPMLPAALEVIDAWGFTYKSHCVWVKKTRNGESLHRGTGFWFTNCHELLLVATRGAVLPPPADQMMPSVLELPIGKHSKKPDLFATLISGWYPHLAKLEMFARPRESEWTIDARDDPAAGWDTWGNEVE
jgi:N6-adenosine-specific RNA methylase IME4